MKLNPQKIVTAYLLSLLLLIAACLFSTFGHAQTINDTLSLKSTIQTQIVPNSNRTITASQLNRILTGFFNVNRNNQKKYDSLYNFWRASPNGFASLGSDGKIPSNQIPAISLVNTYIINSEAAMLALDVEPGDVAIRTDISTTFILSNFPASTLSNWWMLLNPNVEADPTIYSWAKQTTKPSYTWSEITSKPTNLSSFTNDLGNYGAFLTSYTETDPTIYSWAKQVSKPSYTYLEITGTVPTWNQNTTGNAATVTNGVYTTGSYADPAWITSLAGSKITGNISGLAGSETLATVTGRGATTSTTVSFASATFSNRVDFNNAGANILLGGSSINGGIVTSGNNLFIGDYATLTKSLVINMSTGAASFGSNPLTAGSITAYSFYKNYVTAGGLSSPTYETVLGYGASGSNYGAIQFSNEYSSNLATGFRLTLTNQSNVTFDALSISSSGEANFYDVVIVSTRTVLGPAFVADNAAYGNNIGIGFNSGGIVSTNGSGSHVAQNLGTSGSRWNTIYGTAGDYSSSVTAPAFYESSDIRQKKVHTTVSSIDGIDAIQYTFIPNGTQKWGYSAQQVQKILLYAVTKGNDGFLKLDYTTVHTYKIMQLEKRILKLEKLLKI